MCGHRRRLRVEGAGYPADGETVRLGEVAGEGRRCGVSFPWWTLWMLWPLFWLLKGLGALLTPVAAWLTAPVVFTITPLPLLLVGAGVAILALGALHRRRAE